MRFLQCTKKCNVQSGLSLNLFPFIYHLNTYLVKNAKKKKKSNTGEYQNRRFIFGSRKDIHGGCGGLVKLELAWEPAQDCYLFVEQLLSKQKQKNN